MEVKGRFKDLCRDYTGTQVISFTVDINPETINELQDKELRITVKRWREKRSLSANAYFHILCDKLRQKLGISMASCKNHLIADYGQIEYIDGQPMVYKTNAPEEYMKELETLHTKCVKVAKEKGKPVYFYRIYRGSHNYDSTEMSLLIDGAVEECKAQGIETLPPEKLERMVNAWSPS